MSRPHVVHFNESPIGHCLTNVEKGAPNHDSVMVGRTDTENSDADGRGRGVRARECVRVCACVHDMFAIYDNNILPMLIMIVTYVWRVRDLLKCRHACFTTTIL